MATNEKLLGRPAEPALIAAIRRLVEQAGGRMEWEATVPDRVEPWGIRDLTFVPSYTTDVTITFRIDLAGLDSPGEGRV